jgi:hypothetical protein
MLVENLVTTVLTESYFKKLTCGEVTDILIETRLQCLACLQSATVGEWRGEEHYKNCKMANQRSDKKMELLYKKANESLNIAQGY